MIPRCMPAFPRAGALRADALNHGNQASAHVIPAQVSKGLDIVELSAFSCLQFVLPLSNVLSVPF